MAQPRLVYLVVGPSTALALQARYSALSALAFLNNYCTIHISTDQPHAFHNLAPRIQISPIAPPSSPTEIFKLKISLVRDFAQRFLHDPILFLDADTFFFSNPFPILNALSSAIPVLHRSEYRIASHPTGQMRRFRRSLSRAGLASTIPTAEMWNSGVIGLPPGHAHLMDNALATYAQLAPHTPKKYLAEQFAVSHALTSLREPHAADACIFHYWFQKSAYTAAISDRLAACQSLPLDAAAAELHAHPIWLTPPPPKRHWWELPLPEIRGLPPRS
jgi:hypothetical protein